MGDDKRTANWIDQLLVELSDLDKNEGTELLKKCGEACCMSSGLYESAMEVRKQNGGNGDVDTLFNQFRDEYYDPARLTKTENLITLTFEACTCPLVRNGASNPLLCNCTMGYTEKIFETLFEQKVTVFLEKSILQGYSVCRQLIKIGE